MLNKIKYYLHLNGLESFNLDLIEISSFEGVTTITKWDIPDIPQPTQEQLDAITDIEADGFAEGQRQSQKSIELKTTENAFLNLCDTLTGSQDKLGFPELETRLTNLMVIDEKTAILLSLKLLSVDAAGKRYGGLLWWDDCVWHSDIV